MGVHWSTPSWLWPLLLILAAGAVFFGVRAYGRTVPLPPERLRRWLVFLRSLVFLLLVLAIAGPVLSLLRNEHVAAEILVLLEDSGSMAIVDSESPASGPGGGPVSRWDRALAWATAIDSVFANVESPVELVFLRGNGLEPLHEFRLDDPVIPPPTGHGTDLEQLLRKASDRMSGRPVRGLILFSDGQETRGPDPRRAGDLAGEPFPRQGGHVPGSSPGWNIIGVGDPLGSADRVIKDLRYPDTAYEGAEVQVEFAVDHRFAEGAVGTSLRARLFSDATVVADTTVLVDSRVLSLALGFQPAGHGLQVYRLDVSALDNERFLDNNQATLAIDVRKERSRLLLLTGTPGWDVRFLAQAAAGEERLRLDVVHRSATGLVLADSMVSWIPPTDAAGWGAWDGIIIADWTGSLAGIDWAPLQSAVGGGLGLLVIPGPGSTGPTGAVPVESILGRLLPVTDSQWRWISGPMFVAPVARQAGHPVLEGLKKGSAGGPGNFLASLPPLEKVVACEARPGADVLLSARRRVRSAEETDWPLLVVNRSGSGRVAWFGGRNLWELAFWVSGDSGPASTARSTDGGDRAGRRLLRNLLVWTASGEENSGLMFTGRQSFFQEGERIRLAAQWRDMRGRPVLDRKLSLQLRREEAGTDSSGVRTFALDRTDQASGLAEVVLPPLPPGRYSIQLVGQGEPPVRGRLESLVVAGHSIESTQVRMDRRRLAQLAARGMGQFHSSAEPGFETQLWDDLLSRDWSGEQVPRRNRFDFWSGWPFLILVTALLGLEWYLRRRHGLL